MHDMPDFDEALRRHREAFRAEYRANPRLAKYEAALSGDAPNEEEQDNE